MIDVKHVTDKSGKEYPVRFNMTVFYQVAKDDGITTGEIEKFIREITKWKIDQQYRIYLYAFQSGARANKLSFEMKELDFVDWLGDNEAVIAKLGEYLFQALTMDASPDTPKKKGKAVQ